MGGIYPYRRPAPERPQRAYTVEEMALVRALPAPGEPHRPAAVMALAVELGRTASSVETCQLRLTRPPESKRRARAEPRQIITRACLCCQRDFPTDSRFIRLCGPCKSGAMA